MEKVISPDGDVVLALKMNGQTLPVDHGFPVRVVAPGALLLRACRVAVHRRRQRASVRHTHTHLAHTACNTQ